MTFRVYEWQAVAVARVVAGRAKLPTQEDMRKWEEEKMERNGDGLAFFNIGLDFEEYFEGLRMLAGDPAPGSSARALPRFEKRWVEGLTTIIELRKRWWKKERMIAERATETGPDLHT